jgi:hypothetical protein
VSWHAMAPSSQVGWQQGMAVYSTNTHHSDCKSAGIQLRISRPTFETPSPGRIVDRRRQLEGVSYVVSFETPLMLRTSCRSVIGRPGAWGQNRAKPSEQVL